MAKKFSIDQAQGAVGFQKEAIYNALDTIATLMIDNELERRMTPADMRTHNFYMHIQGIALEMTIRGMLIDEQARERLRTELQKEQRKVERALVNHPTIKPIWDKTEKNTGACAAPSRKDGKHKWAKGVPDGPERTCDDCGANRMKIRPFKPTSDDDLKHLLYDLWKLKPITNKDGKITTDKEARERLRDRLKKSQELYREPLELMDRVADIQKQLGFLKFRTDDGRFHAGFNVGVTGTHRWSSNQDQIGRGSNAQNITEKHRHIFIADPGYMLVYADLKQAESNIIAHKAGDEEYIEAHRIGDTHTYVCRLVWPEGINGQKWTGDIKADKKIATSAAPKWDDRPGHDFRFQSKAVQHGSNLGLTSYGLAIQKRIPVEAAAEAQRRYFKAFPGIRSYQNFIRSSVEEQEPIITPLGVRFKQFGRPWDESSFKEALAVIPQSTVGHVISIGLWRIWHQLPEAQLLAQVHDAIVFQVPIGREDLIYDALELMEVPVKIVGVDGKERVTTIGTEAAVGLNWGHYDPEHNPDGVREIVFKSKTEWSLK